MVVCGSFNLVVQTNCKVVFSQTFVFDCFLKPAPCLHAPLPEDWRTCPFGGLVSRTCSSTTLVFILLYYICDSPVRPVENQLTHATVEGDFSTASFRTLSCNHPHHLLQEGNCPAVWRRRRSFIRMSARRGSHMFGKCYRVVPFPGKPYPKSLPRDWLAESFTPEFQFG